MITGIIIIVAASTTRYKASSIHFVELRLRARIRTSWCVSDCGIVQHRFRQKKSLEFQKRTASLMRYAKDALCNVASAPIMTAANHTVSGHGVLLMWLGLVATRVSLSKGFPRIPIRQGRLLLPSLTGSTSCQKMVNDSDGNEINAVSQATVTVHCDHLPRILANRPDAISVCLDYDIYPP